MGSIFEIILSPHCNLYPTWLDRAEVKFLDEIFKTWFDMWIIYVKTKKAVVNFEKRSPMYCLKKCPSLTIPYSSTWRGYALLEWPCFIIYLPLVRSKKVNHTNIANIIVFFKNDSQYKLSLCVHGLNKNIPNCIVLF